jgi:hypothetical protein
MTVFSHLIAAVTSAAGFLVSSTAWAQAARGMNRPGGSRPPSPHRLPDRAYFYGLREATPGSAIVNF